MEVGEHEIQVEKHPYILNAFSMLVLIGYCLFILDDMKSSSNPLPKLLCLDVKKTNLVRQHAITIYQTIISQIRHLGGVVQAPSLEMFGQQYGVMKFEIPPRQFKYF